MKHVDLRTHLALLEREGLMQWVDQEVDKDWEITCVTRLFFQRNSAVNRKALGFRHVKGYDIPVVVGTVSASRQVYVTSLGIGPSPDAVTAKWKQALDNPIEPETVSSAPCQEVVLSGDDVDLNKFPIPTWTPDKDPAPYVTAPCMVSKDLETGIPNVGIYRMQVKGPNRTGMLWDLPSQHGAMHYAQYEAANKPMPVAVVVGAHPTILMSAAAKVPYGVDELAVAGGLLGEALPVVRCKTIDLNVPAFAEIVLEGTIAPGFRETEGPFGEYTGYMGGPYDLPVFEIQCITHRRNPIYQALFSQMPPSESSLMRQIPEEANVYNHLVHKLNIPGIVDVHLPETGGSYAVLWISMKTRYPGQAQQVLCAAWTHHPAFAKWIVVTDEDIDIRDPFQREWVLSWRVEPQRDIFFIPNTSSLLLDPSPAPPDVPLWNRRSSKICIDATKKWSFPAVALPPEKYMNEASRRWESYGLG
jgi:UbiD family decarboxylase